jgi:4-diphosphocytidyl-2-C-methyl-D-erythritol kinase
MGDVPDGSQNLVVQAVTRLRDEAGITAGATMELTKRIPAAAGLGGASSDAAAALMAANAAWGLRWPREELAEWSARLGSDIPFFFGTGAAVGRGRGERLERLAAPAAMHVVVVRPPAGLRTAEVYRACTPAGAPVPVAPVVRALECGRWDQVAQQLWNRLEPAAERLTPWMGRMRSTMERMDCLGYQMTGSGTSWFGICRHAGHAQRVAARLRSAGLGYVVATTTWTGPPPAQRGASST